MNQPPRHYEGKYLVRNPHLRTALEISEVLSRGAARLSRPVSPAAEPSRILLCNIAHIGDVLISTALIPVLRRAFPAARIGFLVGSWAAPVVQDHPDVAKVHVLDNYFLNRSVRSAGRRAARHARTWFKALHEIRAETYDTAIDLYFHWPNAIPLLWAARVPRRIGYDSGGFGPLLTDAYPCREEGCHASELQSALLQSLGLDAERRGDLRMSLPPIAAHGLARIAQGALRPQAYVALHPGTGSPAKEWPLDHWVALALSLRKAGHALVVTGRGAREAEIARAIATAVPSCLDLCDGLTWPEFRLVLRFARLVVGVDSMAAHLAAAEGTPFVAMYSGASLTQRWRPLGTGLVLTPPAASISAMEAIRPHDVFEACQSFL